jgi:hypothetical protein
MKKLIEFNTENGDCLIVEVDIVDLQTDEIIPVSRNDYIITKAQMTFERAIDNIKPVASTIISKLRSLGDKPDEVEVSFGIKMNAEAGAIVASAGLEANYLVKLKWKS